jgi:hypothetical protein
MGRRQDRRAIVELAEKMGYTFLGEKFSGQHLKWRSPTGAIVITGTDLGAARAWNNTVSNLKRGLTQEPQYRKQGA